mmetsp:Transcript_101755/g.311167  ORF Transcript_101755/g.311167 Transcript_101755/m.311167 type:complete len:203 (+) Transcript_101755:1029-1637(+)
MPPRWHLRGRARVQEVRQMQGGEDRNIRDLVFLPVLPTACNFAGCAGRSPRAEGFLSGRRRAGRGRQGVRVRRRQVVHCDVFHFRLLALGVPRSEAAEAHRGRVFPRAQAPAQPRHSPAAGQRRRGGPGVLAGLRRAAGGRAGRLQRRLAACRRGRVQRRRVRGGGARRVGGCLENNNRRECALRCVQEGDAMTSGAARWGG